jgi:hypothetical protein
MADDRSQAGRRSWRGKSEPDRRERPARTERSTYKWADRGKRPAGDARPPDSRSVRLLAGLVSFAVCLGVVVWLIWMINPPRPAGVVLLGADYATNLAIPHNALGYQGLRGIEQLSRAPKRWALFNPAELLLFRNPKSQTVLETADDWDALIAALKKGFHEPTLIIMLALHGGSDSDGAYLMPNQLKRPEDRLDMRKVIASMKELPDAMTKILVVEGAQVEADWRLGMLHNDFARRLKDLEPEIRNVRNLWVLSGCDVDQRCWASEGLGRTVFYHYITEALRGGSAAGSDGRLSLDELYRYVRENVTRWAWAARGAVQKPVLLPAVTAQDDGAAGTGAGASEPLRRNPASIHLATVEAATSPGALPLPDRHSLTEAWRSFHELDELVPHPSVYSPMRWRAYGAALVRYEQLLLAGAAEAAQPVHEQLSQLKQAMNKDRVLQGVSASAGINLVMDALNGGAKDPPEPADFVKIAQATDAQKAQKIWDALQNSEIPSDEGRGSIRPLRNRLADYLLRRAQDAPIKELPRATDRFGLAWLTGELLPAEAHFLRMLRANLSPPLEQRQRSFESLVAQALIVRVLAERAAIGVPLQTDGHYPYCEQVHAWTRSHVEQADTHRRAGEDRLFANDDAAWNLARKDLGTAKDRYNQALDEAGQIRAALAVRDRAFATLPDYSRWLVHRHPEDPGDDLGGRVEALWARAHQLSKLLKRPDEGTEPKEIKQTAHDLNTDLDKLVEQFVHERGTIAKVRLPEDWEVDSAAAAVLFPDDEKLTVRTGIWDRLDDIRLHDQELTKSSVPTPNGADRPDPERVAEAARRRAAIQGAMALAALGETWFRDPKFKEDLDQGDYSKTLERLHTLPTRNEDATTPWWREAARQGDRIGLRFRALRDKVNALANEERGIADLAAFTAFQSNLSEADGLARLVDRGEDPPADSTVEPSSRYRQARVHDFLVWMADRTWRDHWYSEKPSAPPYYQAIVARLFNDAQGLLPELREADQKDRERYSAPGRLALALKGPDPDHLVVTSELEASASYRVVDETGPETLPPGIPVVRPRVTSELNLVPPTADYRTAARGPDALTDFHFNSPTFQAAERRGNGFEALLANPAGLAASLTVEGFFRGQIFWRKTQVDLQVVPDAVAIGPAPSDPPRASVAVRASDEIIRRFGRGTGSIAVVLDCSGSMLEGIAGGNKWTAAKKALYQVLKESVPTGTNVSIWTFSQLPPGDIQVDENGQIPDGVYTPEQLKPILELAAAPELTIKAQRQMTPWDPAQADDVKSLLNGLTPYFDTPLVEAMWNAAEDLAKAQGMKNLLVLTDGNDNRFAHSQKLNPGDKIKIPAFIEKKFGPLGIRVTVVYFHAGRKANNQELQDAKANFEAPLQRLEPWPGRFVQVKDFGELTARLKDGLEQKLVCQILKKSDKKPAGEPLEVTRKDEKPLRWWSAGLDPAYYTLRVIAGQTYEQDVNLQSGDRLIVDLVDDESGGIAFHRARYGDEDEFRDEKKGKGGPWQLAILGNQKTQDQTVGLGLMAAIESTTTAGPALEQLRPGWVDLRLRGAGLNEPPSAFALRWRERMTYPAPVWKLDVPNWRANPADPKNLARPIVTAWWLAKADVAPAAAFDLDPDRVPFDVPLADGGVAVRVEDFGREYHYVEDEPGQPPQLQPCLVIRLAYPVGSPYFADPDSLKETTRYEHRSYSPAGKYAGLFWPVNESQFKNLQGSKVRLFSLNRLREQAEKRQQKVEINLERPRDDVKLPEPPQAIRE